MANKHAPRHPISQALSSPTTTDVDSAAAATATAPAPFTSCLLAISLPKRRGQSGQPHTPKSGLCAVCGTSDVTDDIYLLLFLSPFVCFSPGCFQIPSK